MALTEQDVRHYMMDRTAADHLVLPDIAFTPEDIAFAMKVTARKFNSIRPYVMNVNPNSLPDNTTLFLDGVAATLYEMKRGNASLNDMDYNAGGVSTSVQGNLLRNLDGLIRFHNERFINTATEMKISANLAQAYGPIG